MPSLCDVVEELKPEVVSFHFGLPEPRPRASGSRPPAASIISSATTAAEARWLEARGVDAVIAQGYEAGGHRGMFLTDDIAAQVGTFALIPQIVDAVKVPVIAAGAVDRCARHRGGAGARGGRRADRHRLPLVSRSEDFGAASRRARSRARRRHRVTNLMTGRPARGIVNRVMREIGPMSDVAPDFPLAAGALAPLRAKAEAQGSGDFSPMWAGQAASLGRAHAGRRIDQAARRRGAGADARARGPSGRREGDQARTMRDAGAPRIGGLDALRASPPARTPAWARRASAASKAAASAASSESQDNPARFSSRRPAPALCQTLPAMWWW